MVNYWHFALSVSLTVSDVARMTLKQVMTWAKRLCLVFPILRTSVTLPTCTLTIMTYRKCCYQNKLITNSLPKPSVINKSSCTHFPGTGPLVQPHYLEPKQNRHIATQLPELKLINKARLYNGQNCKTLLKWSKMSKQCVPH